MINENENIVVIVGAPATGKTHLSNVLGDQYPDYKIIHSDDYIKHGYQKSLYVMMEDVLAMKESGIKMIIEGVQSPRLLRKGIELNNFSPDLIIRTDTDAHTKLARYKERNLEYPHAMEKNIETVWNGYRDMLRTMRGGKLPRIIDHAS